MRLRSVAPEWFSDDPSKQAKCVKFPARTDYDPWFPEEEIEEAYADAKAVCNGTFDRSPCPLLELCLEFAMSNNERYGCWGGMNPEERAELRKERKLGSKEDSQDSE